MNCTMSACPTPLFSVREKSTAAPGERLLRRCFKKLATDMIIVRRHTNKRTQGVETVSGHLRLPKVMKVMQRASKGSRRTSRNHLIQVPVALSTSVRGTRAANRPGQDDHLAVFTMTKTIVPVSVPHGMKFTRDPADATNRISHTEANTLETRVVPPHCTPITDKPRTALPPNVPNIPAVALAMPRTNRCRSEVDSLPVRLPTTSNVEDDSNNVKTEIITL
mmetsp:Transcript_720/g.1965  ORF Transcript_720/g.1965 Transcript_720/m.1965 type:complete len:221 (-) Transcript_720:1106-1768(-)